MEGLDILYNEEKYTFVDCINFMNKFYIIMTKDNVVYIKEMMVSKEETILLDIDDITYNTVRGIAKI